MNYSESEQVVKSSGNSLKPATGKTLKFIDEKPEFDLSWLWYWESFKELNTERKLEYGEIPWSSINQYCIRYGVEDIDSFTHVIREMDKVFMEEQRKQVNK